VYLEAEIFGGDGTPAGVAWWDGNVCVAPISTGLQMQNRSDRARWAFNWLLRELGLTRGDAVEEFDAVGLYRQRHT